MEGREGVKGKGQYSSLGLYLEERLTCQPLVYHLCIPDRSHSAYVAAISRQDFGDYARGALIIYCSWPLCSGTMAVDALSCALLRTGRSV